MEAGSLAAIIQENNWQVTKDSENNGYARDVLVRYLPGVMRQELPAVIAAVKANATYTDPRTTPEGPWTGTWTGGLIWYEKSVEPGKNTEGTFNLYQALHKGGTSAVAIITENNCRYKVTQTWYWDVASIATVPAGTSGITYSISTPLRDEEFGVYTFYIEKKEQIYQTIAEYTNEREAFEYRQKTAHVGVRTGDLTDTGTAITALPDLGSQTAGIISEISRSKNENCTQDIDVLKRNSVAVPAADNTKQINLFDTTVSVTDRNDAAAETLPSTQTAGSIVTVKSYENEFAKFDNEVTTKTATSVTDAVVSKVYEKYEIVADVVDKNATTATAAPTSQTAGEIKTVISEKNNYARFDNKTHTRTAVEGLDAELEKSMSADETVTRDLDRNTTEPTLPATFTAGTIVEMLKRINDFNKYDVNTTTKQAVYLYDSYTWTDRYGTNSAWWGINATADNYASVISTAALTAATNNSVTRSKNKYGLYNYLITKQAYGGTSAAVGESHQTGSSTKYQFGYIYDGTEKRAVRKKRIVTQAWDLTWFTTLSAAKGFYGTGAEGSHGVQSGGQFGGVKTSTPTFGSWSSDE